MPELPEVEAIAGSLRDEAAGRAVARVDVAAVGVLKTYDPPVTALGGLTVDVVSRRGKFLDLSVGGLHLVVHLARAGWLTWRHELPAKPPRPGKGPLAMRVHLATLDDGTDGDGTDGGGTDGGGTDGDGHAGFDVTEAGTQKRLAVYVVRTPADVPGLARLGVDPLSSSFTVDALLELLHGRRNQLKGVLTDQSLIAGIGNAYSDEILHVARLSPFKPAANLSESEVATLHRAVVETLQDAVGRAEGVDTGSLKAAKRSGMRVHGRTGESCPVCGDAVREVSFADSSLQYCPTCQTGGKPLADRRMSRLLK